MQVVRWNLTRKRRRLEDADAIVLSVQKSGRTWLRTLLFRYLALASGREFDLEGEALVGSGAPRVYFIHERAAHLRRASSLERALGRYVLPLRVARRKKLVVLVRDPRDTVLSAWFSQSRRFGRSDLDKARFIRHPREGLPATLDALESWQIRFGEHPQRHLVRYEDLRRDTAGELSRLLVFLGLAPDAQQVDAAVAFASLENMRARETDGSLASKRLGAGDPRDPDSYKVRRGEVGGHLEAFEREDLAWMDAQLAQLHPAYGYGSAAQARCD